MIKTFTDANGKKGKIGSKVQIINIYTKELTNVILEVVDGHKQGADGTILHFESAPMPEFPHNKSHCANRVVIV